MVSLATPARPGGASLLTARTGTHMFHSEFPLERVAQVQSHSFQLGFARQVLRLLPTSERVQYEATSGGLLMRATSENALAKPLRLLRDLYGPDLVVSAPQVRCVSEGGCQYEPIMRLRVQLEARHREAVRNDLVLRKAVILEEHERPRSPRTCVLRAEAPLRNVLGYADALSELTDGTAVHWIWLDRYVPLEGPPGGHAA